jgi:hypothetical protein
VPAPKAPEKVNWRMKKIIKFPKKIVEICEQFNKKINRKTKNFHQQTKEGQCASALINNRQKMISHECSSSIRSQINNK